MEKHGNTGNLPKFTPKRATTGILKLNYPPTIAYKFVKEWQEKARTNEDATQELRNVIADIVALIEVAMNNLTPANPNQIPRIPTPTDSVNK